MKRFHTLQFRLSALLFCFGFALIIMGGVRQYRRETEAQLEFMRLNAYSEGTRLSGLAQHLLRRRLPQAVDLAISYASVQPDLRLGLVCDAKDVIINTTKKQWRGGNLSASPLADLRGEIDAAREGTDGRIEEIELGTRLVGIFPFWDAAGEQSKGVVILDYDLSNPIAAARWRALSESAAQGCALLGGCMMLWAFLNVMVTSRVGLIEEQARSIGLHTEGPEPITGGDELAMISRGIARAVASLQRTERRFSQIASTMRDVFWIAPAEKGMLPYATDAYGTLFGLPPSRLEHHRWDWLTKIVPEDRRKALELLRRLRRGEAEADVEMRLLSGDDWQRTRWVLVRAQSVPQSGPRDAANSGPLPIVGVVMEISDRKDVEKRLLQAAEDERRRIGYDIHDDICQRLAAAQLKSGVLRATLLRMGMPQAGLAGDVAGELAEATDIARGFARGLAPVAMGVAALPEALEQLSLFLRRAFSVGCEAECAPMEGLLDEEGAAQVYRIAQELATNAAKHAKPTHIRIALSEVNGHAWLEVSHDGSGFDPATTPRGHGMGLHLLRQRLDALGATIEFQKRPGSSGGGSAFCDIPRASGNPTTTPTTT